jgi:hypothetical protein
MWKRIAIKAAQQSENVITNSTRAHTVSYINLITAQTIAVTNETKQSRALGFSCLR